MRYLFISFLFLLCSCSSDSGGGLLPETPESPVNISDRITLYSGIGSITAGQTRGEGIISSTSGDLLVNFVRIDKASGSSSYPTDYPTTGAINDGIFVDKINATVIGSTGVVSFLSHYAVNDLRQIYRSDDGYTKLVGWYPNTGSTWTPSRREVIFSGTLDGTTDILATATVEGSKQDPFDITKKLKFAHMLTQIRVFAYLEDANYQDLWGNLSNIAFVGKAQTCTLTLPLTNDPIGSTPSASFSGNANLLLQKMDNSGAVFNVALPVGKPDPDKGAVPLGYAMIAPLSETEKLTIQITTVKGNIQNVVLSPDADLPLKAGNSYNIFLKLYATQIEATATITDWVEAPASQQPDEVGIG